jgi:hypothetical protein
MAKQELNRVQDYFIRVFPHDLTDKDFEELRTLVIEWLIEKAKGT